MHCVRKLLPAHQWNVAHDTALPGRAAFGLEGRHPAGKGVDSRRSGGPSPITVRPDGTVIDLSAIEATTSAWLERVDTASAVRAAAGRGLGTIDSLVDNSTAEFNPDKPRLLAPCDLQAIKAAGVTFADSRSSGSSRSGPRATARREAPRRSCDDPRRRPAGLYAGLAGGDAR